MLAIKSNKISYNFADQTSLHNYKQAFDQIDASFKLRIYHLTNCRINATVKALKTTDKSE